MKTSIKTIAGDPSARTDVCRHRLVGLAAPDLAAPPDSQRLDQPAGADGDRPDPAKDREALKGASNGGSTILAARSSSPRLGKAFAEP